jgi:tetratricopeptide (TPR) repeat protein
MSEKQLSDENQSPPRQSRKWTRWLGIFLILFAVSAAWMLGVAYFGTQSGQKQRVETQQIEMAAQLARQVELAQADVENGRFSLATRRLGWVLTQQPNHSQAVALTEQINNAQSATPTLTPAPTTPTPAPSPTPGEITDTGAELARIESLINAAKWEQAISALSAFQRAFPNDERPRTDQMLYDTLITYGLELLEGDQVERGLFYLEQAEVLGDLPQEALDYQFWGETYLQGIAFYDVNWDVAAYYFRNLCLSAPFYQSSCELLNESLISLGDQYSYAQDWCPAIPVYEEVLRYDNMQAVRESLIAAREGCALATPTPSAIITDTIPAGE